jgi:hypothetical protein
MRSMWHAIVKGVVGGFAGGHGVTYTTSHRFFNSRPRRNRRVVWAISVNSLQGQ